MNTQMEIESEKQFREITLEKLKLCNVLKKSKKVKNAEFQSEMSSRNGDNLSIRKQMKKVKQKHIKSILKHEFIVNLNN